MNAEPVPALRALSGRALSDLARGLRSGDLGTDASSFMVRHVVPGIGETAAAELCSLLSAGLAAEHAALFLDAIVAERSSRGRSACIELVTSGPDTVGGTRDTGVVLRELFATAEQRVLIIGFAVHQGREVFAVLAERMQRIPDLMVRLCLDVRRAPGDTTRSDAFLRRFAEWFIKREWPGSRLPDLYYDPRSLAENDNRRGSLHAKCVVIDGERAFIGSANFTEAAQMRNIEIGLLVTDPVVASAAERHIDGLISRGYLLPILPRP